MKTQKDWQKKTLDELEGVRTRILQEDSYLLMTITQLRAEKPLCEFDIEDLRILIGQSIGLKFLIPIAIEELEKDILVEGDFYEGDLLKAILTSNTTTYWREEKENWTKICSLFEQNKDKLESFDTTKSIRDGWFDSYKEFLKIH